MSRLYPTIIALVVVLSLVCLIDIQGFFGRESGTTTIAGARRRLSSSLRLAETVVEKQPSGLAEQVVVLAKLDQTPLYDPSETNDVWKKNLFRRLDRIRAVCGELCTINDQTSLDRYTVAGGQSFRQLRVPVQCDAILQNADLDATDTTVPFPIPSQLLPYYNMGGLVHYTNLHQLSNVVDNNNKNKHKNKPIYWTRRNVGSYIKSCATPGQIIQPAFGPATNRFRDSLQKYVDLQDKRVLVLGGGREQPWVEAICLYLGARHVTTLVPDHNHDHIQSKHSQITVVSQTQFRTVHARGRVNPYDAVVSFSWLDHAGLGRYGDALNPWADLLAVARARCVTKPGGYLAVAVPSPRDAVYHNDNRSYGPIRYPLLTANWVQIDQEDHHHNEQERFAQPTYVFQNSLEP